MKLGRRQGYASLFLDRSRGGPAYGHFEIARADLDTVLLRLEQKVGEDGQSRSFLDHTGDRLKLSHEHGFSDHEFHILFP